MLEIALQFMKSVVSEHLKIKLGRADLVKFPNDHLSKETPFSLDRLTLLLVNMEEEKIMRQADPYHSTTASGQTGSVQPEIRLNLYILFAARFEHYENSLTFLSWILQFFQQNRVLDQKKFPELAQSIGQLSVELVTQDTNEQAALWGSLNSPQHPSLLFRVKVLRFADSTVNTLSTKITQSSLTLTTTGIQP